MWCSKVVSDIRLLCTSVGRRFSHQTITSAPSSVQDGGKLRVVLRIVSGS